MKRTNRYSDWLKIPRSVTNPDYYQLLGLPEFETNKVKIKGAYYRRVAMVSAFQNPSTAVDCDELLSELATARDCLTDESAREAYNLELRQPKSNNDALTVAPDENDALSLAPLEDDEVSPVPNVNEELVIVPEQDDSPVEIVLNDTRQMHQDGDSAWDVAEAADALGAVDDQVIAEDVVESSDDLQALASIEIGGGIDDILNQPLSAGSLTHGQLTRSVRAAKSEEKRKAPVIPIAIGVGGLALASSLAALLLLTSAQTPPSTDQIVNSTSTEQSGERAPVDTVQRRPAPAVVPEVESDDVFQLR